MPTDHQAEAAFFDLDKTVIARASMVAFGKPLYKAGLLSRWLLLRALYGQLVYLYLGADENRMARMRESALRLTRGWSQAHISEVVRETLDEVIDPIIYDEALALIRSHQAAGRKVFIISASPQEVVVPLSEYLGADEAIATRPDVDDDGRYTGDVAFYAYGPFKAEAMREVAERDGIDLSASYAYSDSITDIPMLEAVGHPVAVNPERGLAAYAEEQGWEIQTFSRDVRMRDRVSMPPPAATAAVSGGLVAVAAGGATWWWLRRPSTSWPPRRPGQRRSRGTAASSWRHLTASVRPRAWLRR